MLKIKSFVLAVLLVLVVPGRVHAQTSRIILWGSAIADLGTTWSAAPGFREANPLLGQNKLRQASVMLSLTALTDWSTSRMERPSPAKMSKPSRWIVIGVHLAAVAWNLSQSRKMSAVGRY